MVMLGRYQHYKGKEYIVVGTARHSETLDELVVYRACYVSDDFGKDALWVRPRASFEATVIVEGVEVPRFRKILD